MPELREGSKLKILIWLVSLFALLILVRQVAISFSHTLVARQYSTVKDSTEFVPFYKGKQWLFHSFPVFHPLEKLVFSPDGHPVVNASFKRALKQSTAKLPVSLDKEHIQQLSLLTERQFPGRKGQVLAVWLVTYHQYREAKMSLLKDRKAGIESLAAFRELIQLREVYFGKAQANLLFEHQHRFANNLARMEGK
jgi:hypothetical protein